jgi:DNA uptake protein ComE-like DNA-binding protein
MNRIWVALIWFAMAGAPLALPACAAPSQKAASLTAPVAIDINRAFADDLARLPGVGPKLAQQLVR